MPGPIFAFSSAPGKLGRGSSAIEQLLLDLKAGRAGALYCDPTVSPGSNLAPAQDETQPSTPTPNARLLAPKTERVHHPDPPPATLIRRLKRETKTRRIE